MTPARQRAKDRLRRQLEASVEEVEMTDEELTAAFGVDGVSLKAERVSDRVVVYMVADGKIYAVMSPMGRTDPRETIPKLRYWLDDERLKAKHGTDDLVKAHALDIVLGCA